MQGLIFSIIVKYRLTGGRPNSLLWHEHLEDIFRASANEIQKEICNRFGRKLREMRIQR